MSLLYPFYVRFKFFLSFFVLFDRVFVLFRLILQSFCPFVLYLTEFLSFFQPAIATRCSALVNATRPEGACASLAMTATTASGALVLVAMAEHILRLAFCFVCTSVEAAPEVAHSVRVHA